MMRVIDFPVRIEGNEAVLRLWLNDTQIGELAAWSRAEAMPAWLRQKIGETLERNGWRVVHADGSPGSFAEYFDTATIIPLDQETEEAKP